MKQPELSSQQYQQVLKYMEATRQQDFNLATQTMKAHNFNLQNAVRIKLGINDHQSNNNFNQGHPDYGQHYDDVHDNQENILAARNARNQEDIRRYMQYLREKQNRSLLLGILSYAKDIVVGLVSGITQLIVPEFILRKIIRSKFSNLYKQQIIPQLKDCKLSKLLKNSYMSRKPIMFIISDADRPHACILNLLNRPPIAKKINQSFILSGTIKTDKQCDKIQGQKQPPTIIICRVSLFQKLEITKRYVGQNAILQLDVDKLNYALRDHQRAARKDRNLLVRYRNYIRRNYYGNRPGYQQQQQQEQQLYQFQKPTIVSDMIKKQNEDYKKVQQQTKRKQSLQLLQIQKQMQEQKKHKQLQQQRRVRKMSIPDEPQQGQIIRFSFRCPDGTVKIRKFQAEEKLDLVYHWVQTNEEIQFQDIKKRQFELLHGYPPASLSQKRQLKLKEVFESDQEKIIIREL